MPNPRKEFFSEMSEQFEVKTEVVRKYFRAWAKVMVKNVRKRGNDKIGYVDLFAGKGRYKDGSKSTPLRVLEEAIRDKDFRQMLVTVFNDSDPDNVSDLDREITALPGIKFLTHAPIITNEKMGDDLIGSLTGMPDIPTLFFLDPWGYKGLSLNLVRTVLQPFGCDCIFFFNYNRINAALSNPLFTANMDLFFGAERARALRSSLTRKSPSERQLLIIGAVKQALKERGGEFTKEYCFKDDSGEKTSHFLIFTSKHVLGYDLMKAIMAGESSSDDHGVASFGFNPRDKEKASNPTLFELTDPVGDLGASLLIEFAGKTMTAGTIYNQHHVDTDFIFSNYQDALRLLEETRRIVTDPPVEKRIRGGRVTFSKNVTVTFPSTRG